MAGSRIPAALRTRLGDEATFGLMELLDAERKGWSEEVLKSASNGFERRLSGEISVSRVEVRNVLHDGLTAVRAEIGSVRTDLTHALSDGLTSVRQELSTTRTEMLKWSFLFWVGQVAAIAGLLAFMLRGVR